MPISKQLSEYLKRGSWIRNLFEEGQRLSKESAEPVYDLTIGNPDLEPIQKFKTALEHAAGGNVPGAHKYMANAGYEETREAVAQSVGRDAGLDGCSKDQVVMTVGAAGAINVALKVLLNPGDEVIVSRPYFVEYQFYAENHGGKVVFVDTKADFDLDPQAIEAAITDKTKVVLINNPNNPSGVVYPQQTLDEVGDVLRRHSAGREAPIFLLDDAPYRKLVYDMDLCTSSLKAYENTLFASSHSKDLGIPGERIGFLLISPRCQGWQRVFAGMAFANRCLGFVNAPALMQRVVASLQDDVIDLDWYRKKRDRIYSALTELGYQTPYPGGAFYLFPKAPGGDDMAFIETLKAKRVLVVPGTGFGQPGYFRIAYCVKDETIDGALQALAAVMRK